MSTTGTPKYNSAAGFTTSSSQVSIRGMIGQASVTLEVRPTEPLENAETLKG